MIELVSLGIIAYMFYLLFIRGWVWGILFVFFALFGGALLIWQVVPASHSVAIVAFGLPISWAMTFSIVITILGVAFFDSFFGSPG